MDIKFSSASSDDVQPSGEVELCFSADTNQRKDACLAYLDVNFSPARWVCQDKCLKKKGDSLCGKTDHFTNFAILLAGNQDGCEDPEMIFDEAWKDGVLIACLAAFIWGLLLVFSVWVLFTHSGKKLLLGKEGYRLHILRSLGDQTSITVQNEGPTEEL